MKKLNLLLLFYAYAILMPAFIICIILCIPASDSFSQSGCDNGNFENGDFTNWTGATGLNGNTIGISSVISDAVIFTPASLPYGTFSGPPTNAINLVTSGDDPTLGSVIKRTHLNSSNAARIGNQYPQFGIDLLAKTFTVDASTSNFTFWYALILQNPQGHGIDGNWQPFLIIRVRNSSNVIVPGLGITIISDAANPFFQKSYIGPETIVYRNWECGNIDLSTLSGQQVTIEFIVGDCGLSAHWGYAYIDDICLGCDGSPTGDCSIDVLPSTCDNFPLQVCGDFTLPQPPAPATASLGSIDLKIFQNGIQVGSTITGPVITSNDFCFTLNSSDFPAVPPDGFDFVASANFIITNGSAITNITKSSSTPGNGITPGTNNDYNVDCGDTICMKLTRDTTYCDSTGTYIYEFQVFNNSPTKYIEQLEIAVDSPQPPEYVVAVPSTINITTPLPPRTMSQVYKVKLIGPGAVAYSEVCYTLSAHYLHDDCPWCCYIENCIKLPICSCADVIQDSIYCVNDEYFYKFTLKNGTQYDVTKIQLTSPGIVPITFVPQTFHFGTPILPGQLFPSLTAKILGGSTGLTIPVKIKLFSHDFECCYFELPYTLPPCDTLFLRLRSFIEGRYNPVTSLMSGANIQVELRNSFSPYSLVETATGQLNDSGYCTLKFLSAQNGVNYYIVLKNSNSLETWSKSPGQSFIGDELNFNFLSLSQAYGSNLKLIDNSPQYYGIITGDINQDGGVDLSDITFIYNSAVAFVTENSDLNGDGITDLTDIVLAYNNALDFASVIRP